MKMAKGSVQCSEFHSLLLSFLLERVDEVSIFGCRGSGRSLLFYIEVQHFPREFVAFLDLGRRVALLHFFFPRVKLLLKLLNLRLLCLIQLKAEYSGEPAIFRGCIHLVDIDLELERAVDDEPFADFELHLDDGMRLDLREGR